MGRTKEKTPWKVNLYECDYAWGIKLDEIIYFNNKKEALDFVENFNSKNDKDEVPIWYMCAEYTGK